MKLLNPLMLSGAVLAAAPAAAHTYAYDDGAVRVIYDTHGYRSSHVRDHYRPYYHSYGYRYAQPHRYHGHRHYRGCGHDYRHKRHHHHGHRNHH